MPDLITLTCPTCGAKLKVSNQVHLLMCANCGNEFMVHRGDGAIYLAPMAQDVRQIRVGVDKTAAELAVVRLTKEIADLDAQIRAAQSAPMDRWASESQWEGFLQAIAILSIIAAALGFIKSTPSIGVFAIVLLIVSLVAFQIIKHRRLRTAGEKKDTELSKLSKTQSEKAETLAKNRAIAES